MKPMLIVEAVFCDHLDHWKNARGLKQFRGRGRKQFRGRGRERGRYKDKRVEEKHTSTDTAQFRRREARRRASEKALRRYLQNLNRERYELLAVENPAAPETEAPADGPAGESKIAVEPDRDYTLSCHLDNNDKKEDARPRVITLHASDDEGKVRLMIVGYVFDGHGGQEVTRRMDSLPDADVKTIAGMGPEAWLADQRQKILEDCPSRSGGMLTAFRVIFKGSKTRIQVAHLGDSSLVILPQDGRVIKTHDHKPTNDLIPIEERNYILVPGTSCETTNFGINDGALEFGIKRDHRSRSGWKTCSYAICKETGRKIAAYGVVGDGGAFPTTPIRTIDIDLDQPFRLVTGSDGIWDVIYQEDPFLRKESLSADHLCVEARSRWKGPVRLVELDSNGDRVRTFPPQQGMCPKGGDDASCIVLDVI